jgi:hypothetical protein
MKKIFALGLSILILLVALMGCNNSNETTHENEEINGIKTIGNPTPADFIGQDFFIYLDLVALNVTDIDWVVEYNLAEGVLLGEIMRTNIEDNFLEWDATHLPIGTKIYRHSLRPDLLIAIYDDTKIPYMPMREG